MNRRLVAAGFCAGLVAAVAAPAATVAAAQPAPAKPVVTDAVQVTADPNPVRAHTSPQMARNPKTGELTIVEGDVRNTRECKVYVSSDDGRSWAPGGNPLREPYTDCSFHADWGPYATMAYDKSGTLYMAIEASDRSLFDLARNDIPRRIFMARSTDSGRSWNTSTVYVPPTGDGNIGTNKGATVAVDQKDPRYVYVGWRQGLQAGSEKLKTQIAASSDGGRTWAPPVEVSDSHGGDFPWLTVTPDGVLHGVSWTRVWPTPPAGQLNPVRDLFEVSSSDHGRTFSRHEIDPGNQQHEHPPVVTSDPKTGAIYVAWSAQPDANNQAPGYLGDLDVYFRSSTDGGHTWSEKKMLNDDKPKQANHIDPGISIAPDGRIDVAWYDSRLNPGPVGNRTETGINDVYYTYSNDGGKTWAANIRITDRSADRSIGVWANNIDQRLNVGIASSPTGAYFAWSDTRNDDPNNQPEDVYMASVQLSGDSANGLATVPATSKGTPSWLLVVAGLAVGMGVAMVIAFARNRMSGSGGGSGAASGVPSPVRT